MLPTNIYDQQRRNLARTKMFMFGFVLFLVFLGLGADAFLYGSGGTPGFPICTIGALLVGSFSAWWSVKGGDQMVLESSSARPIDLNDPGQRVVDNVVEEMAIAAGVPKPKVYIVPDSDPNAFATGPSPEKASIAVTSGLVDRLSREELQAVIGHEMSHVRNYDTRLMTVVAALAGAILLLSDWARRDLWRGGGSSRSRDDRDGGSGGGALGVIFFALWLVSIILAPIIAQIVAMAVSREREYLADASGAELTRNPLALASALQKIDAAVEPTASIKQGVAHLCIADPRGRKLNESESAFANLFGTHPPIAKRIELLRQMSYQRLAGAPPASG
ncbi:MAG TPA: M48 family metalloprotease [Thermoanaerobaculia bacterium]|nr:M48 family metalloprotease [Thermoanaerobaculia bacterium]